MHVNSYSGKNEGGEKLNENGENWEGKKYDYDETDKGKRISNEYIKTIFKKYSTKNHNSISNHEEHKHAVNDNFISISKEKQKYSEDKNTSATCEEKNLTEKGDITESLHFENYNILGYSFKKNFQKVIQSKNSNFGEETSTTSEEKSIKEKQFNQHSESECSIHERIGKETDVLLVNRDATPIHVIRVDQEVICNSLKENSPFLEKNVIQEEITTYTDTKQNFNEELKCVSDKKQLILHGERIYEPENIIEMKKRKEYKRTTHELENTHGRKIVEEIIMNYKKRNTGNGSSNTNNDRKSKNKIDFLKKGEMDKDLFFAPKKTAAQLNMEKKEIEKQLLQTINEENNLANVTKTKNKGAVLYFNKMNTPTTLINKTLNMKKESNNGSITTGGTTLNLISHLGINRTTKMNNSVSNFQMNSSSSFNNFNKYNSDGLNNGDSKLDFFLKRMNSGSGSGTTVAPPHGTGTTNGIGIGTGVPSFLRNSNSGTMNMGIGGVGIDRLNMDTMDYDYDEAVDEKLAEEYKRDFCFLLREMIAYCDYLKDRRRSDQKEIIKIRRSYNEVCKLLKEALSRETQNQEQLLKLRESVEMYNEQLKNLQSSKDEHTEFYNKQIEDLMKLNCNLEEKLQDIASENQKLKKIARTSLQYSTDNNELKNRLDELSGEYSALLLENDHLKLENSKMENEKNVLVAEKNSMHCKIHEMENEMKRKAKEKEKEKEKIKEQMGTSPFIVNSDDELKEQIEKYLSLNADQRVELFANFLEHWRSINIEGQKLYQLAYTQDIYIDTNNIMNMDTNSNMDMNMNTNEKERKKKETVEVLEMAKEED